MKQTTLKIWIALFAGVLFASFAEAQKSEFHWEQLNQKSNRLKGKLTGTVYVLTSKSNSNFFLQDDWANGSITLEDNDVFEGLRLRYNAFEDDLVVYNDNLRNLFIVDKEKVKNFTVESGNRMHNFVKYYYEGYPAGDRYFEVLYSGGREFLAFRQIVEEKTSPYVDKFGIMRDTRFQYKSTYYIYSSETGFRKIRMRRRSLLNVFPDDKRDIRRLLRRNNVRILEETAMTRAFKLLDENGFLN